MTQPAYKSIAAAERDGFVRSAGRPWSDGSELITIRGVELQRAPSDAFEKEYWACFGCTLRKPPGCSSGPSPVAYYISWASRGRFSPMPLYRAHQVIESGYEGDDLVDLTPLLLPVSEAA